MEALTTSIVTGAAGGMGRAVCQTLAVSGWQVLAIDHNETRLATLAASHAAITALPIALDSPALEERIQQALEEMPTVAGLVNLVGVSRGKPIDVLEDSDWHASFAINVTPAMQLTRLVAPLMRAAGKGSIVNVGSPVGLVGANKPSYAASKAALHGLTMSTARNLGPDNIRVNLLLPGPTITEMTKDWPQERRDAIAAGTFLNRLCQPEEIANMIHFLLGPCSSYLTGSTIDMTAGSLWGH
ncbi:SDR family oxidoreductase [Halomonas qaidamensis]|uniref:SDR family oxidoreductase n=1 Tax=Halomonas qaidamensis TaxID=2866211 RepID=A0ABY6JR89_9GAMM|nr:SDR family oxidoreductase [Halomonas qaidamensis]UYV19467.1 SDR family oxidoreductase [Halomonas qaidamensis]